MEKMKSKIELGDVDLSEKDLRPEGAKVRITTWVDGDTIMKLKSESAEQGKGYQTLINEVLRSHAFGSPEAEVSYAQISTIVKAVMSNMATHKESRAVVSEKKAKRSVRDVSFQSNRSARVKRASR